MSRLPSAVLAIEDKTSLKADLVAAKKCLTAAKAEVKSWERQIQALNKKLGKKIVKKTV